MVGDLGVDVFFVLSGFLISSLLFSELEKSGSVAIRGFYFRRALRILPAYYVALAGWAAIGMPAALGYAMPRSYIWANILYIKNFLPYLHQFMNLSWSLAIEEHFYLLFAPFLLLLSRVQALSSVAIFILLLSSIGVAVADAALRGYLKCSLNSAAHKNVPTFLFFLVSTGNLVAEPKLPSSVPSSTLTSSLL